MNEAWVNTAINSWTADGITLNTGASPDLIRQAEDKIGFTFPEDFKALYIVMNGFLNWDCTPNAFSIWPIERILEEYNPNDPLGYIGICDYLIHCHDLGFVKDRSGVFISHGGHELNRIATSFAEVIHLINTDADVIY